MGRDTTDTQVLEVSNEETKSDSMGWLGNFGSPNKSEEEPDPPVLLSPIPTLEPGICSSADEGANINNNKRRRGKMMVSLQSVQQTSWRILAHSWVNILLVFVPAGIIVRFVPQVHGGVIFATNCVAIIPLAGLMAYATESVAREMGDALGALMNVTLGNSVELIIFIALTKNKIRIVQASILGSILANVLLILGMAFFLGGMRYREQLYNNTVTQMSACLLSLSVISLVLPTAFHASFRNTNVADMLSLKISRGTSVILLLVYIIFLVFQLKSHAYLYKSTPRHIVDAEAMPGPAAAWLESGNSGGSSESRYDSGGSGHSARAKFGKGIRDMAVGRTSTRRKPNAMSEKNIAGSQSLNIDITSPPSKSHSLSHMESMETCVDQVDREENTAESEKRPSLVAHQDEKGKKKIEGNIDAVLMNEGSVTWETNIQTGSSNEEVEHGASLSPADGLGSINKQCEKQQESGHAGPSSPKRALRNLRGSVSHITPVLFPPVSANEEATRGQNDTSGGRRTDSLPRPLRGQYDHQIGVSSVPSRVGIPSGDIDDDELTVDEQTVVDMEQEEYLPRTPAVLLLLVSTGLVALCAEFLVGSIEEVTKSSTLGETFIGLIVLPIVGNAAEHITSITVAMKNKMDLAIGVTVGSSIQIALCITPLVVILGWVMGKDMSLYFTLFETVCLFVSTFITNFLVLDGRSNYMEGALLCAVYVLIAMVAFFYPEGPAANAWGGGQGAMGGH